MKIAIYYLVTSVYKDYWKGFYESLSNFFPGEEKKVILFSDSKDMQYIENDDVEWHFINHYPWPIISMYKNFTILNNFAEDYDYHFHFNSNVIFKPNVNYSNLKSSLDTGKLILVQHWNNAPYSNPFDSSLRYIHGGLWGGCKYIAKKCVKSIQIF